MIYLNIDNIFTNRVQNVQSGILETNISDHFPIFAVFNNYFSNNEEKCKIEYRALHDSNLENLYINLCSYRVNDFINEDNVNESLNNLDNILLLELNKCCPIKTKFVSPREQKNPWINSELKSLIKRRENFYKLFLQHKMTKNEYNRFRNFVTSRIQTTKKNHYANLFHNLKNDIKSNKKQ